MISMMENFKMNIFLWLNNPAWLWESPHPRRLCTEDWLYSFLLPLPSLPNPSAPGVRGQRAGCGRACSGGRKGRGAPEPQQEEANPPATASPVRPRLGPRHVGPLLAHFDLVFQRQTIMLSNKNIFCICCQK